MSFPCSAITSLPAIPKMTSPKLQINQLKNVFPLFCKDVIAEQGKDIFELIDLKFGACHFSVIVPEEKQQLKLKDLNYKRVATKFPVTASRFFRQQGLQVEVIKLNGNVELAPLMGLSDAIVDLVSTGRTLRENRLIELIPIMESTARLICNQVSFRIKHREIQDLLAQLNQTLEGGKKKI